MQNRCTNNQSKCRVCDIPAKERLNYFTGQFLAVRDFSDEQSYHIGKHRQHNHYLHGYGTVCGLRVVEHPTPECRNRYVIIEPGLAFDCCGREIALREDFPVDLSQFLAPTISIAATSHAGVTPKNLLISLCYSECETELVPALYSECGCDETGCEASRVREGYEVKVELVDQLPRPVLTEPVGVSLKWETTVNLENAWRVAFDPQRKLLYVLNAADAGQIMVYNADNNCLIRSINLNAHGIDIAISPTGTHLYVICHVPNGILGKYVLRVIDLNDPSKVKDFVLSPVVLVSGQGQPQVAVAADGRIYTLDTIAQKVTIWNTAINEGTVLVPNAIYSDIATGTDPRAIAVSPDGAWLFIAEAADVDKCIKAAKVDTLTSTARVIYTIPVTDKPILLAVSGDSQRLYMITANKKVHAFRIQETLSPQSPLSEIGSGVDLGPNDNPVAISVSPSGRWAYVLVKDGSDNGFVRTVDGEKLATEPGDAVADPVAVVSDPQDMLLAPDGRRLYVAGKGSAAQLCGGVSVLEVNEEACSEIFWRTLEGCPTCIGDACVLLAAIPNYKANMFITNREIDNRIRPLIPSTQTLQEAILCALETNIGKQGPEGPKGEDGHDGQNGRDGQGLEEGLTQIKALSWIHGKQNNSLSEILDDAGNLKGMGIIIQFTGPVHTEPIDAEHIFQILIRTKGEAGLTCRCAIAGRILAVKNLVFDNTPGSENVIKRATYTEDDKSDGVAFWITDENVINTVRETNSDLWVLLRGDFVMDVRDDPEDERAIDAEFVRGDIKSGTGDRPKGSSFGIQGGLFESWFWIK